MFRERRTQLNVNVSSAAIEKCRAMGINMSEVCNEALKAFTMEYETQTITGKCEHNYTWPFTSADGLYKECKKCGKTIKVIWDEKPEVWLLP